jgi:RNA polymerase sigma-70 factor (ECF subfamily)
MEDFADEVLVQEAKNGNLEAFAKLIECYQERIYHTIFGLTRNHCDTDDLAQETFMYAFKSLKDFKQKSSFYTWIYRISINLTLNSLKKKKREKGREDFVENYSYLKESHSSSLSPEDDSLKKELEEKLNEAINSLPLSYKTSFILVAFQGMTHSQAAQILNCTENTVSWRMHKARKMLQARLKPYLKEVRDEM